MSIFDKIIRAITNKDAIEIAEKTNGKTERTGKTLQELDRLLGCIIESENGERRSGKERRKNGW